MYEFVSDTVAEFGPLTRIQVRFTHGGWIHAYLDSEAGTLLITSDWGDWTHRWGLAGSGFVEFILDRNREKWMWHYVAHKLMYGREDRVLDVRATQSHLRRRLAYGYRKRPRHAYEIAQYIEALGCIHSMERIEDVYYNDAVQVFHSVDPDDMIMEPSPEVIRLREFILPAIGRAYTQHRLQTAA